MQKTIFYLSILSLLLMCVSLNATAQVSGEEFANAVFAELNKVRANPASLIPDLQAMRKKFEGIALREGNVLIYTKEGIKAVDEAILFLKKAAPLPPLQLSRGMSLAALDHVQQQGESGATGHIGVDGSTPRQRLERHGSWYHMMGENIAYSNRNPRQVIIDLIVDDGVPDRGHRDNIFNPQYKKVGIAYGPHAAHGSMCVMVFAGEFNN